MSASPWKSGAAPTLCPPAKDRCLRAFFEYYGAVQGLEIITKVARDARKNGVRIDPAEYVESDAAWCFIRTFAEQL